MKSILCCAFLFLVYFLPAQDAKTKLDHWLIKNSSKLGGRAVLLIYGKGKLLYHNSVNEVSGRQKRIAKIVGKRTGKLISTDDLDANSKIAIASCSKWYTAALAMTFVEENAFALEDSIGSFLPNMSAHGKGGIKIWQCLSHLTGIKSPGIQEDLKVFKNFQTMDEALDHIAALPMEGEPGKTFHYSNIGLQLIAAVIEKISKKNFATVFSERIAIPLGLQNTDWGEGKVVLAAGGARSTANDYLKFLTMILNKGMSNGIKILSDKSIQEMQINRIGESVQVIYAPAEAGKWGYGFGEWVMKDATANSGSNGVSSPGLFGSFPWVENKNKYCAILTTLNLNSKNRHQLYTELKGLVDDLVLVE